MFLYPNSTNLLYYMLPPVSLYLSSSLTRHSLFCSPVSLDGICVLFPLCLSLSCLLACSVLQNHVLKWRFRYAVCFYMLIALTCFTRCFLPFLSISLPHSLFYSSVSLEYMSCISLSISLSCSKDDNSASSAQN